MMKGSVLCSVLLFMLLHAGVINEVSVEFQKFVDFSFFFIVFVGNIECFGIGTSNTFLSPHKVRYLLLIRFSIRIALLSNNIE